MNRLILCGVPIEDFQDGDDKRFETLSSIDPEKVTIFQNEEDPHGKPSQVKDLVDGINPKIVVNTKPRNDHEYPYEEDFIALLQ